MYKRQTLKRVVDAVIHRRGPNCIAAQTAGFLQYCDRCTLLSCAHRGRQSGSAPADHNDIVDFKRFFLLDRCFRERPETLFIGKALTFQQLFNPPAQSLAGFSRSGDGVDLQGLILDVYKRQEDGLYSAPGRFVCDCATRNGISELNRNAVLQSVQR